MLSSAPRSIRIFLRSGRLTPPIITRSLQLFASNAVKTFPTSPHLIQVCGKRSISGSASPSIPTMCTGKSSASAASAIKVGKEPRPAMMPSGPVTFVVLSKLVCSLSTAWRCDIARDAELAIRIALDEVDDLTGEFIGRKHRFDVLELLLHSSFA